MKVLLVNGSPNEYGCTRRALTEAERVFNELGIETEVLNIGSDPISGCLGCRGCRDILKCVIDDKVNEFVDLAETADGFIFASPVYYASANGALISFMDRVFYLDRCAKRNVFAFKPAAAIASARRAGTTPTIDQLNKYFQIASMPIASSTYWNEVHGNTPTEVEEDGEGLRTVRNLARQMTWMIRSFNEANIEKPKFEYKPSTNFIR